MAKHGIFINHRHTNRGLAGRIYDFFERKGISPFLDNHSLSQGEYRRDLIEVIKETPYFLILLSNGVLDNLSADGMYYQELETAFNKSDRRIIVISIGDFKFPQNLPEPIKSISECNFYQLALDMSNFHEVMERVFEKDISQELIRDVLNWKTLYTSKGNTYLMPRSKLEAEIATLENRFGKELIECVKQNKEFTGEQRIRTIRMSCYAASIIFTPQREMVDLQAYDRGLMFNIFATLLKDPDFSLEVIINAPDCRSVADAIEYEKLGNSALDDRPEAVFLGSYAGIKTLVETDQIFKEAERSRRFRFMVTNSVLPYALFQIVYKDSWKEYNHIKVDLYSEGILSSMDRRSMLIFESVDKENYDFFVERYNYIRKPRQSRAIIEQNSDKWLRMWEELNG